MRQCQHLIYRVDLAVQRLFACFNTEGQRNGTSPAIDLVSVKADGAHILLKLLIAQWCAQHIVKCLLAGHSDAEAIEWHAAIGWIGNARAADDLAVGQHSIGSQRQLVRIPGLGQLLIGLGLAMLEVGIPLKALIEHRKAAVRTDYKTGGRADVVAA